MNRFTFLLVLTGLLTTLFSSNALAQECPNGLFSYVQLDERGNGVRVCAKSTRQATQAVAAIGVLDPSRAVSTHVDPSDASAHVSSGFGRVGMSGGPAYGFHPPPDDPRRAWGIRDSLLDGIQGTSFEAQTRDAADRGVRDGQHRQVMDRLDELEETLLARITDLELRLRGAIAVGNKDLERKFRAELGDCKAQLAQATSTPKSTPKSTIPTPSETGPEAEKKAEEDPNKDKDDEPEVEKPRRRLTQSYKRKK